MCKELGVWREENERKKQLKYLKVNNYKKSKIDGRKLKAKEISIGNILKKIQGERVKNEKK